MNIEILGTAVEFKFEGDGLAAGEFKGYGAVFGNQDSHGDVIQPGAFIETLEQLKAAGRSLPMHVMHGVFGGDGLPVGVWKSVEEDGKGLRVHGKISGIKTDQGQMNYERVKDRAYGGISIGYSVNPDGSVRGKSAGEPKRTLKSLKLHEISLVDAPSNAMATFDEIKRRLEDKTILSTPQSTKAAEALSAAIRLHLMTMNGGDSPTVDERQQFLSHLQDAHHALTGLRMPEGIKAVPKSLRGLEDTLREIGFSRTQAQLVAEAGFKSIMPRDEVHDQAVDEATKRRAAGAAEALKFLR
jgi:HK97 family phage prohead protease